MNSLDIRVQRSEKVRGTFHDTASRHDLVILAMVSKILRREDDDVAFVSAKRGQKARVTVSVTTSRRPV